MSGDPHPVIKLGHELLQTGSIASGRLKNYKDAFSSFPGFNIDNIAELKLAGLRSIFTDPSSASRYYKPCELHPDRINYPDLEVEPTDFSSVKPSKPFSPNALVQLERYGSFVATNADPQIPVYDLFKTAAAVHDCLEPAKDASIEKKCMLVGCDFSGIQDTVYTISSKGALKTLRARSFMLELLTEHIIYEILKVAEAGRHAIIYSGGGGFGLLLPNKEGLKESIEKFGDILNEWAYSEFFGKLFIALDVLQFKGESLKTKKAFQTLRQDQSDHLDRQKRRKFLKQLDKLFEPKMPEQTSVQTECQITRRDDLDEYTMLDLESGTLMADVSPNDREDAKRIWVSESCFHQHRLGDKLIDTNFILRYWNEIDRSKKEHHGTLVLPGLDGRKVYYGLSEHSTVDTEMVWAFNTWKDRQVFQYANHVRKHSDLSSYAQRKEDESLQEENRASAANHTATFQGLASSSCGADLIGALRMDVDDLGNLFSRIESATMLSARSRMMSLFFKVYLNAICAQRKTDILGKNNDQENAWGQSGRNALVIYAGGDDLFIVGAWDDTAELAFDIQQEFSHFTQGQGISGGLTLHQPKFPLYQMARLSAEAESFAKHDRAEGHPVSQKNRIALFYDGGKRFRQHYVYSDSKRYMLSMDWELGRGYILPLMKVYARCGDIELIPDKRKIFVLDKRSFSYQTIEKWFKVLDVYWKKGQLYLPAMARVMSDVESVFDVKSQKLFDQLYLYLYKTPYEDEVNLANLHIALSWLSYLRREK